LGATLAALNHLEDSPAVRSVQAIVRVATAQIEERGPGYSRIAASSYSRSRSERPRQRCRNNGPLEPVAEERQGENEVMQQTNPARPMHGWVYADLGGFLTHPFNDDLNGLDHNGSDGLAGSRHQST
jgi:hypothetical protein